MEVETLKVGNETVYIDWRLKEFRILDFIAGIIFIPFESDQGRQLLKLYNKMKGVTK